MGSPLNQGRGISRYSTGKLLAVAIFLAVAVPQAIGADSSNYDPTKDIGTLGKALLCELPAKDALRDARTALQRLEKGKVFALKKEERGTVTWVRKGSDGLPELSNEQFAPWGLLESISLSSQAISAWFGGATPPDLSQFVMTPWEKNTKGKPISSGPNTIKDTGNGVAIYQGARYAIKLSCQPGRQAKDDTAQGKSGGNGQSKAVDVKALERFEMKSREAALADSLPEKTVRALISIDLLALADKVQMVRSCKLKGDRNRLEESFDKELTKLYFEMMPPENGDSPELDWGWSVAALVRDRKNAEGTDAYWGRVEEEGNRLCPGLMTAYRQRFAFPPCTLTDDSGMKPGKLYHMGIGEGKPKSCS